MNGLTKHIQNLGQFTRWGSNPPEYEALIYTNIQLICSMTFNVTRVAALHTSVIFTHKLYRRFHKRKLKVFLTKCITFSSDYSSCYTADITTDVPFVYIV